MSTSRWTTLAERRTESVTLALLSHPATGPGQHTHCVPEYAASLFLTPQPQRPRGSYGHRPGMHSLQLGSLVLVPADMPMHVFLPETPARTLFCCRFDRDYFHRATGVEDRWEGAALQACGDVRDAGIESLLRRLADEIETPGFAGDTLVSGLSLVCLAEIARYLHRSQQTVAAGGLAPWQLRRIRERVEDEVQTPPDVESLARLCGISGRHLMRAFRQSTGQTVMEYVQQVRLQRAEHLLAGTDLPLREVATRLGFGHYSAFAGAFRRAAGETPRGFRQRHTPGSIPD